MKTNASTSFFYLILSILYSLENSGRFKHRLGLEASLNTISSKLMSTQWLSTFLCKPLDNLYIWLIKLNGDCLKRWVCRDLREDLLKHCVDINLEKNVFKPFSTVVICSNRLEILTTYRVDNNNKWHNYLFLTLIKNILFWDFNLR